MAALALGFFNPIFRADATFSDIAGHQTVVFPWAAYPNGFTDAYPQSDQANAFHPWQVLINQSLDDRSLPFWNRYSFTGAPFLTNGGGGGLYPPKLLLSAALPPTWVHDLFLLLHVFLSGVAMYFLLRELSVRFLGATLAAVAWMLSAFTFGWIQLEHSPVVAAALPAGLLFVHRAARLRSLRSALLAGVILGVTSFHTVSITLLVWPVVLGYAAALGLSDAAKARRHRSWSDGRAAAVVPIAAVVATIGTAALVLVPTGLAAQEAGRQPLPYEDLVRDLDVRLSVFLTTLWPSSEQPTADLLHELVFVGTAVALLAIIGAVSRRPGSRFAVALAVLTLLVTTGTLMTRVAYEAVPGFEHFRPLGRALFLWSFAIALLGGIGFDVVQRRLTRPLLSRIVIALGVSAVALTALQLLTYARRINPPFQPRDSAFLYPETPAIKALRRDAEVRGPTEAQRVLPLRRDFGDVPWRPPVLWGGIGTAIGVESLSGYESILPRRILATMRVVAGEDPDHVLDVEHFGSFIPSYFVSSTRFDLLPRLGVTTIYAPPDIDDDPGWTSTRFAPLKLRPVYSGPDGKIFDIRGTEPRAYVVHDAVRVPDARAALRRFADGNFDYMHNVVFEASVEDVGPPSSTSAVARPTRDAVTVRAPGANTESYDVAATRPGWLVISGMWGPGWVAKVDGRPAPVLRANYNQRAVPIPAGRFTVELEYQPPGLVTGAAVTGATLVVVVGLSLAAYRRRRASG